MKHFRCIALLCLALGAGARPRAAESEDGLLTHTLLLGNAALLTSALIGPRLDISVGRARLISVSGLGGALVGLGLDLLGNVENEGVALGIPMVTSPRA